MKKILSIILVAAFMLTFVAPSALALPAVPPVISDIPGITRRKNPLQIILKCVTAYRRARRAIPISLQPNVKAITSMLAPSG